MTATTVDVAKFPARLHATLSGLKRGPVSVVRGAQVTDPEVLAWYDALASRGLVTRTDREGRSVYAINDGGCEA